MYVRNFVLNQNTNFSKNTIREIIVEWEFQKRNKLA